jgi:RNA polymerase-binding transcription factor
VSDPDPRAVLEAALRRARSRLADLTGDYAGMVEASRDSNADDEHDPEGATIAFERSQVGALAADTRQQVSELEAALVRVDEATYGVCEVCGTTIPSARLEARPAARTCIAHAR